MDLARHLDLAGENLLNCLCPESNYMPYWHMVVRADQRAEYQFRPNGDGHNVGRWWNALLRLQASTGFDIPPAMEAAMLENTWRLCDNPSGILLQDPDPTRSWTWYIHSYRETMLALGLLAQYRNSERARDQGLRAIRQMRKASQDPDRWDLSRWRPDLADVELSGNGCDPSYTHGRAIEGLLCFYAATQALGALEEAERLSDFHFQRTVNDDGSLAAGCGHHTHSFLNTIRGLLLLAALKNQQDRLDTILATYRQTIAAMITRSGFATHDIGADFGGDIASPGDTALIALLLWDRFQDPQLLEDAERIVRCRLIPAQVLDPMPVKPVDHRAGDSVTNLPERFVGAIGGAVGHVRGQTCVTDFTAAALHTLIELYDRSVDVGDSYVRVNFHFDCRRPGVEVKSVRDGTKATITVSNETGKDLLVRIPSWTPADSLLVLANKKPIDLKVVDGFARVQAGFADVELHYTLPEYTTEERWRDEFATRETVTFKWRGDQIHDAEPLGPYQAPFPLECGSFLDPN